MEVFEGVAEGVLLGPVTGISSAGVAVSEGTGVLVKEIMSEFVGVKKRLANAFCVNARSAGVAVAVLFGSRMTSACLSTLPPDNINGMPNARRQMTGRTRNITKLWGLSAGFTLLHTFEFLTLIEYE
jgi:hypothetical protein